jgi:hypothetical protein
LQTLTVGTEYAGADNVVSAGVVGGAWVARRPLLPCNALGGRFYVELTAGTFVAFTRSATPHAQVTAGLIWECVCAGAHNLSAPLLNSSSPLCTPAFSVSSDLRINGTSTALDFTYNCSAGASCSDTVFYATLQGVGVPGNVTFGWMRLSSGSVVSPATWLLALLVCLAIAMQQQL